MDHTIARLKGSILEYHILKTTPCHPSSHLPIKIRQNRSRRDTIFIEYTKNPKFLHRSHHKQHAAFPAHLPPTHHWKWDEQKSEGFNTFFWNTLGLSFVLYFQQCIPRLKIKYHALFWKHYCLAIMEAYLWLKPQNLDSWEKASLFQVLHSTPFWEKRYIYSQSEENHATKNPNHVCSTALRQMYYISF